MDPQGIALNILKLASCGLCNKHGINCIAVELRGKKMKRWNSFIFGSSLCQWCLKFWVQWHFLGMSQNIQQGYGMTYWVQPCCILYNYWKGLPRFSQYCSKLAFNLTQATHVTGTGCSGNMALDFIAGAYVETYLPRSYCFVKKD